MKKLGKEYVLYTNNYGTGFDLWEITGKSATVLTM